MRYTERDAAGMSIAITLCDERHHRETSLFLPHISNHVQLNIHYRGRGLHGFSDFGPHIVSVLQDRFVDGAFGEDVVLLV